MNRQIMDRNVKLVILRGEYWYGGVVNEEGEYG
jgi:hypothetical protein